ncbi:hypothetical protein [Kitasatospora griseola]|uniref:hypothetical protein n=1 Tax=Kitasatospora griseola TaxID=2064 RepID=UPI0037F3909B
MDTDAAYAAQLAAELRLFVDSGDVDPDAAQACTELLDSVAGAQLLGCLDRLADDLL